MADQVAIPTHKDEAMLMVLTGIAWLREHAPDVLLECRMSVPEGWQLVPVEPTDEMLETVRKEMEWCNPVGIFSKMLKAAPKPGERDDPR